VYAYARSAVIAFGMTESGGEAIVALSADADGVRLYVNKSLPDPKGLLMGSGGKVRYVAIAAASDLDRGPIHALLTAARKHSGVRFSRAKPTRVIFKSGTSARRAP
jgi:hypothetical protein